MNSKYFANRIRDIIEKCSFDFYVVQQDNNIICPCFNPDTKQADTSCTRCLGTGHKITIRKYRGACISDTKSSQGMNTETSRITKTYYMDIKYNMQENNYIIEDDSVYYVYKIEKKRGLDGIFTHQQILAVKVTHDHDLILNNFYKIIDKHNKKG